jgi:hypothetical protein
MARIRTIKPEFWQDQKMAADLSRDQRLFYVALWNEADDEGRFIAHPRRLLGLTFPYDDDIHEQFIEDSLRALAETKRIVLYVHEGEQYGQLTKFQEHQRINRPTPSKLPFPNDLNGSLSTHGGLNEPSVPEQGTGNREQGTGSGNARDDDFTAWLGDESQTVVGCSLVHRAEVRRALYQHYGPPGLRSNAWKREDGSSVPESERPRLLTLALTGYEAEGHRSIVTSEFAGMVRKIVRDEGSTSAKSNLAAFLAPLTEEGAA